RRDAGPDDEAGVTLDRERRRVRAWRLIDGKRRRSWLKRHEDGFVVFAREYLFRLYFADVVVFRVFVARQRQHVLALVDFDRVAVGVVFLRLVVDGDLEDRHVARNV